MKKSKVLQKKKVGKEVYLGGGYYRQRVKIDGVSFTEHFVKPARTSQSVGGFPEGKKSHGKN